MQLSLPLPLIGTKIHTSNGIFYSILCFYREASRCLYLRLWGVNQVLSFNFTDLTPELHSLSKPNLSQARESHLIALGNLLHSKALYVTPGLI